MVIRFSEVLARRTWNGVFRQARAAVERRPPSMAVRIGAQIDMACIVTEARGRCETELSDGEDRKDEAGNAVE